MRNIIEANGNYYLVDTADTFDVGWETIVVRCNTKGNASIKNWRTPIRMFHHVGEREAKRGHEKVCSNLKRYI